MERGFGKLEERVAEARRHRYYGPQWLPRKALRSRTQQPGGWCGSGWGLRVGLFHALSGRATLNDLPVPFAPSLPWLDQSFPMSRKSRNSVFGKAHDSVTAEATSVQGVLSVALPLLLFFDFCSFVFLPTPLLEMTQVTREPGRA